jgi:hypothetical protein
MIMDGVPLYTLILSILNITTQKVLMICKVARKCLAQRRQEHREERLRKSINHESHRADTRGEPKRGWSSRQQRSGPPATKRVLTTRYAREHRGHRERV